MKKLLTQTAAALLFVAGYTSAEIAVVVHPSNADALDAGTISRIYLGKLKEFPSGGQVVPINQDEGAGATGEFNDKVLSKSASQLKAYWSKLVFTGKGTPPQSVASDAEVINLVSANPNFIGYVDAAAVTGAVKVVAKF